MRSAPSIEAKRAIVVARRSGESAAGPKSESWALRGRSGRAVKRKPTMREPAIERRAADEEKGLEREEWPFEVHPFREAGRRQARLERARIDAACRRMQLAPCLPQTACDFSFGQLRQFADRGEAPALEHLSDLESG